MFIREDAMIHYTTTTFRRGKSALHEAPSNFSIRYPEVTTVSDAELLATLVDGAAATGTSVSQARQFLDEQHGLIGLSRASDGELAIFGAEAIRIRAALELARRLALAPPRQRLVVNRPDKIAPHLLLTMRPLEQEVLKCVLLTTRLHLIKIVDVHQGTLNSSLVRAGDVFREPVRLGAAVVILAHNHPTGDERASPEDIEVTQQLIAAGKMLDIRVEDHLIIGDTWLSMRMAGVVWPRRHA
jgi:DNA repair protein RadC